MNKVGYLFDPVYLEHRPDSYHPENPQRLKAIDDAVEKSGLKSDLVLIEAEPAVKEDILLNHTKEYYKRVEASQEIEFGNFDPDTYFCKDTYRAAMLAAGGCIKAGKMVTEGELNSAFCAVRPPGHHSEQSYTKGFCIFNNIAILARRLISDYSLKRIAILDWDGHHGNGTQHAFYDTDQVHFTSMHAFPFYPGSGSSNDTGEGKGKGFTLNFPLGLGAGDKQYLDPVRDEWIPAMEDYKPEILLVSTGYDAFTSDPYVFLEVSSEAISEVCRIAKKVAEKYCDGKIILVLEGGYVLDYIGKAVVDHLKILME
ncbi:MAG: histone deacetylase [candidate division Zixibacteria bacterium]|nr:histone deacetylase [candidate division Zixibacteria bacterium]